jgi:hypothetical protein
MKEPMKLLDEYSKEIEMDTSIDVTNLMEKQLSSPYVKNKWLYRLMQTKRDLISLIDTKDAYLHNSMENDNPLNLSKSLIAKKMETNLDYKTLNIKIKEQELLVEYLDMAVNKIFSQIGFDFKNLVELLKMESL